MKPRAVQRRRTRYWRMPPHTKYVGRGTRWGNRYRVGELLRYPQAQRSGGSVLEAWRQGWPLSAQQAVDLYRWELGRYPERFPPLEELRGWNLACWCPLDQPCHRDVLLELANLENDDA